MVHPHADMFVGKIIQVVTVGTCRVTVGFLLIYVDLCRGTENNKELAMIGRSNVTFILVYTPQILGKSLLDTTPAVSGRPKRPSHQRRS